MNPRPLVLIPTALLVAAAAPACGGDTSPEGMVTDAEVMCEEFVQRELDTAVEFSDSQAVVADPETWTYEATGTVNYKDESGPA